MPSLREQVADLSGRVETLENHLRAIDERLGGEQDQRPLADEATYARAARIVREHERGSSKRA